MLVLLSFLGGRQQTDAGSIVHFRTIYGDLLVDLYDQEKPVTCANFKALVRNGAYANTFFHRVVPGFVAQGGGFFSYAPYSTNMFAPPWNGLGSVPNFGPITNEFKVGPHLANTNGTIAMAKTADPNSATSQFFFNLTNNVSSLDDTNNSGGFTVFGHVVLDTGPAAYGGVLGLFNLMSPGYGIIDMRWWYSTDPVAGLFATLPVTYFDGPFPPRSLDLFYVDVSLFSVSISLTNNARRISWDSVYGRTNYLEYTTQFPANWTTLLATNGNGGRYSFTDSAPPASSRFYRLRVAK